MPSNPVLDALRSLLHSTEGQSTDLGGGRRELTLRSIPRLKETTFSFRLADAALLTRGKKKPDEMAADNAAEGDGGEMGDGEMEDGPGFRSIGSVVGTASSTSVDWYGTEMSLDALRGMAEQFNSDAGVPLLPTHGDWFSVPEWDDVIGRSVSAEIQRAEVAEPYDSAEAGYTLVVTSALLDVEKARELRDRLDAGQPIGQSIGGWFTGMTVIYNEETDDLERIIILSVQLDHLAITRMPANPDSYGLANLRSRVSGALRAARIVPEVESVERNRESVTVPSARAASLDTAAGPGHDALDPEIVNRASPDVEPDMPNEQQLADLITRSVQAGVAPVQQDLAAIRERLSSLEQRQAAPTPQAAPAPAARTEAAPTPPARLSAREQELELEVAQLRGTVSALIDRPQRRGVHASTPDRVPVVSAGPGASGALRSLVAECRAAAPGSALALIVERHVETLAEDEGPASVRGAGSVNSLRQILRAGLIAAETDGLLSRREAVQWS